MPHTGPHCCRYRMFYIRLSLHFFLRLDLSFDLHISFWKTLFWLTFWSKFTPRLYFDQNSTSREVTPVPPPRLRKIRKRMVVPPSSRVLRSHARLAKSAAALAFDGNLLDFDPRFWLKCTLFWSKFWKMHSFSSHFILNRISKNLLHA